MSRTIETSSIQCGPEGIQENLDPAYRHFFEEPDYRKRWSKLLELSKTDYASFRVLFMIEIVALLDTWSEPTTENLKRLLDLTLSGTRLGTKFENLFYLFAPVWPLEMAKYDVFVYKTWIDRDTTTYKGYFFTSLKLHFTAIVQAWWAFETVMNDVAGIIREQRKDRLTASQLQILNEVSVGVGKKGEVEERSHYQAIESRIQFIFELLTRRPIDRGSRTWQDLMNLKNARDTHQHRFGKPDSHLQVNARIAIEGMKAVKAIIRDVFAETPEFSARFAYRFFEFWSCGIDSPFMWDGRCGDGFNLGINVVDPAAIISLFAPAPSTIGPS